MQLGIRRLSYVVALLATAGVHAGDVPSLQNGGFEDDTGVGIPGWEVRANGHTVSIRTERPASGEASLQVQSANAPHATMVRQPISVAAIHEGPLRLNGKLRSDQVSGSAVLFVIVEGEAGRLFVDDMRDRPVQGTTDWTTYSVDIPQLEAATRAWAGVLLLGGGTVWADDIHLLARDFGEEMSPAAATYLDAALDIMAARYVNRDDVDWQALREFARRSAAGAHTPRDTWPAIAAAVTRLGDGHSTFVRPREIPDTNETQVAHPPEIAIGHEMLDGRIGYIAVPAIQTAPDSETATAYIDHMHAALRMLASKGACGWLVDLRANTGGTMWPMLAGIGPLAGEGVLGAHVAPGNVRSEWWYRDGRAGVKSAEGSRMRSASSSGPGDFLPDHVPVAVLLSSNTASAGEAVAIAFEGMKGVRSFGTPTAGLATANVAIPLVDGARLVLAIAHSADRMGKIHEAIVPDEVLAGVSSETVRETARRWLSRQPACATGIE